jgi:hypothetical protein
MDELRSVAAALRRDKLSIFDRMPESRSVTSKIQNQPNDRRLVVSGKIHFGGWITKLGCCGDQRVQAPRILRI